MSMTEQELSDEISAVIEARMSVPWQDAEPAAKALATMVKQYIERHIAAGVQGAANPAAEAIQYHNAVGPIDAIYAAFSAMDNNDTALEEWPQRAIDALAFAGWAVVPYDLPFEILGEAGMTGVFETGNPKHGWDWLVAKTRIGPHGPPAATPPANPPEAGVTDEMVERYCEAAYQSFSALNPMVKDHFRKAVRAGLTAALAPQPKDAT